MSAFLLILIIVFVVLVVRPLLKAYSYYRKIKETVFTGRYATGSPRPQRGTYDHRSKKIIDKDIGEYVAFEEISAESSIYSETHADSREGSVVKENQIVDAEWEDI